MGNKLNKRYGLFTAICMVVGIVVGSGVFFKAETVLSATGGNLGLGILSWIIGGAIMIICAYNFAVLATRYEKVSGIVDYGEALVGENYGYMIGWFMATLYLPSLTGVLAWVTSRYFCALIGVDPTGGIAMTVAFVILISLFFINAISPKLAGKLQVSITVVKLIPLILMAIVGLIVGLSNGMLVTNFTTIVDPSITPSKGLSTAIVGCAFAYEGWIVATSINAELRDAKRNLPKALVGGTFIILIVYLTYYIGLAGAVTNESLLGAGAKGVQDAFSALFGDAGGMILMIIVVISTYCTTNALMLGNVRAFYSIASRGKGINPERYATVDKSTNMPMNSAIISLVFATIWMLYFFGSMLQQQSWFGPFTFDISEITIVTLYLFYIPIFFQMIRKEKDLNVLQRYIMPIFALISCLLMIAACIVSKGIANLYYLIVFTLIMFIGYLYRKNKSLETEVILKQ